MTLAQLSALIAAENAIHNPSAAAPRPGSAADLRAAAHMRRAG